MPSERPRLVMICGPSGSGKSTLASRVADLLTELRVPARYCDADSFHSDEAKAQAAAGRPLDDSYRREWVERMTREISVWCGQEMVTVFACSALKLWIRQQLVEACGQAVQVIWLDTSEAVLKGRLERRDESHTHWFPARLLGSQLDAMERPNGEEENVLFVNGDKGDVETLTASVLTLIGYDSQP